MDLTAILQLVPEAAVPLVVTILGGLFIYFKIGRERKETKNERDGQLNELDKRLTIVEQKTDEIAEKTRLNEQRYIDIQSGIYEIKGQLDLVLPIIVEKTSKS